VPSYGLLILCCVLGWFVSSALVRVFFVEGESECTSERARGQFSIFGAIEEMFATDFWGSARIKELFQRCGCKPLGGLEFGLRNRIERKVWQNVEADCAQGVHRKCRKGGAVLSSQFSELSSQSFRLGCPTVSRVERLETADQCAGGVGVLRLRGRFAFAERPLRSG
jgi:hypothetical protein